MKTTPVHSRLRSRPASRKTSAAIAALAAAMLALQASPILHAAAGSWQSNALDQGVAETLTVAASAWAVSPSMVEGDAVYVGLTPGVNLGTNFSYYYAVGIGSTPAAFARFSQSPGAGTFAPSGGTLAVTRVPAWFNTGNWAGGTVPNGIDDQATIATNTATPSILLDRDVTLGSLSVDTTSSSTYGLSLLSGSRTAGPFSTLTFKTSSGTPTITLTGGNSLSLSESKLSGNIPGNASAKLTIVGNQGLTIDNQNAVGTPIAVNSNAAVPAPGNTPTYGSGQVRFGFGLDWSKFSGDLTITRGVVQSLAGGSLNNNLSSFPLASALVLGTGTNTARLEIVGNGSTGPVSVRGLGGTSPNASIINTSGGTAQTFQIGSYGVASDSYSFAGNIGDNTYASTLASAPAIRLVKIGAGTQTLTGSNTLNATAANSIAVAVNGGKLSLSTTGALGTVTAGQGEMNADSSILFHNGEFEISGLGVAAPRTQKFGGVLLFGSLTNPNTISVDDKHASQSNSLSTLTVVADPAQPASVTFGALRPRNYLTGTPTQVLNGVTMLFRGTNLGATPGPGVASILFTVPPAAYDGSLFALGSGALGSTEAAVFKGALADTSPTGRGSAFATYDPATGVRPLASNERNTVTSGAAYDVASSSDNIRLSLSADEAITGHLSNTLELRNESGAPRTVTNSGTALYAANGLLFSGNQPITLEGGTITGTAASTSEDVVIHSINSSLVTLKSDVANVGQLGLTAASSLQGWITLNGSGDLRVEGKLTVGNFGGIAFNGTGTTTIANAIENATSLNFNQGVVKFDTGASWTGLPRILVAPEGKLDLNGITGTPTTNRFSDVNVTINPAGLTLNSAGGEVTNSSSTPVDLYLAGATNGNASSQATSTAFFGKITGNINLVVDKSTLNTTTLAYTYGTQAFANVNTYTGTTTILSGTLNLARGGQLPATTVVTLGTTGTAQNSTLSLGDGNGSTNGSVRQEIAGLYATGTGTAAVVNNGSNVGQLTINSGVGVDNVYTGNLGITPTANGNNQNLFSLRKTGPGTFEPAGAVVAYTGGTVIEGGVLRVANDTFLGQIGSLTGAAGSADAPAAPMSAFANNIVLNGGTLLVSASPTASINSLRGIGLGPISGSVGGTGTLSVNAGTTLTYGGVIASAGNTGSQTLIKSGAGVLALNGASTFTGVTQVSSGSLGGTGSLASNVTVSSGASLAPGASGVGTFTINGQLTLNSGSALDIEVGAPGISDLVQLGGTLNAAGPATINLINTGGLAVGSYTVLTGATPPSTTNLSVGALPGGLVGTLSVVGNSLTVNVAVAPVLTALEQWRQTYFGATANSGNGADAGDPDGDGLANLIEYATGTNPTVAGTSPFSVSVSSGILSLTYNRVADTTLTYTVEGSNDLVTWTPVAAVNNPSTGAQNVAGSVTVTDSSAFTGRRFLRLVVTY